MRNICLLLLIMLAPVPVPVAAHATDSSSHFFGLELGMSDYEVRKTLEKVADRDTTKSSYKQTWLVRDDRFSHVQLRFDRSWKLEWVTLIARRDGRRVRYDEFGKIKDARRAGDFIYAWTVPATKDAPGYAITARGEEPEYVSYVSLSKRSPHPPVQAKRDSGAAPVDSSSVPPQAETQPAPRKGAGR